ncbi:MAG TPA: BPL-N domain-containing protein [Methanobacterium sp.]
MVIKILIPLIIVLIVISLFLGDKNTENENYKEVKVLAYSGSNTDENCVYLMGKILDQSNSQNMVPGVKFVYNTTKVINSQTLSDCDVLIMPGSSKGYDYISNEDVNVDDLKSFVSSGKGFIGICAGAYSAAQYTDNWYYGWGLAPNVINIPYLEVGNVTIDATSAGNEVLGYSDKFISHINGPAMYTSGDGVVTFATYTYTNSSYGGYAAIVGDRYGDGRTVLSGVHPELTPQHPEILVKLIIWAYNGSFVNDTAGVNTGT